MNSIVPIKGNVQHAITMDPSVWIFDDRRIDLEDFFYRGVTLKKTSLKNIKGVWGNIGPVK